MATAGLVIDEELCDECGRCAAVCPNEAIVPGASRAPSDLEKSHEED